MDTFNMETESHSLLYTEEFSGKIKSQAFNDDDSVPSLSDLNPTLEYSYDLRELLGKEGLFPELVGGGEGQEADAGADLCAPAEDAALAEEDEPMRGQNEEIVDESAVTTSIANATSLAPVITIKQEDLAKFGFGAGVQLQVVVGNSILPSHPEEAHQVVVPSSKVSVRNLATQIGAISSSGSASTSNTRRASHKNHLKAPPPTPKASSRRRSLERDSDEYRQKRMRNNVAVRKSRDKAKVRQQETEGRVGDLTKKNEELQKKCDLLAKELSVLKGLFLNVGAQIPAQLDELLD